MNIYLIRHGRQNSRLCNVNVPLSSLGREQAELVGKRLAFYNIDGLYSSDLIRAVETADIIKSQIQTIYTSSNLHHEIREGIREIDFGELEGKSDEVIYTDYASFMNEKDKMLEDLPYPDGECGLDVFKRAMPVINEIAHSGRKNVVVVSHGGTIRSLLAGLLGLDQSKMRLFGDGLENCSITQLHYNEEKNRYYVQGFNDYAHLEQNAALLRKNW